MSRVYFHTRNHDDVELLGSERAHCNLLYWDLALGVMKIDDDSYFGRDNVFFQALDPKVDDRRHVKAALRSGFDERFFVTPQGRYPASTVVANTALTLGSPAVRFMTRLHLQCEIHAWIAPEDRAWCAGVIQEGLSSGVMRGGMGWVEVHDLLLRDKKSPVVMSYSVCEQFPNSGIAGWKPPEDDPENYDAWGDLPRAKRWDMAFEGLRAAEGQVQITPENLKDTRFFGCKKNCFDVENEIMIPRAKAETEARKARREAAAARGELPSIMDMD